MSSLHIRSLGEPPNSIWALNATQVRDLTASLSPTPGGGSISVFTATLGLALVHKGASISLKRSGEDNARREALVELCETVTSALALMSRFADEDSEAFQGYLEARSLPRSTQEEKTLRDEAVEAAILRATRIPIGSAKEICAGLEQAERAVTSFGSTLTDGHCWGSVDHEGCCGCCAFECGCECSDISRTRRRGWLCSGKGWSWGELRGYVRLRLWRRIRPGLRNLAGLWLLRSGCDHRPENGAGL